jgi:hypothetical protein
MVFWDDFWTSNFHMLELHGQSKLFGSASEESVMYNPMEKEDLKEFLKNTVVDGRYTDLPEEIFGEVPEVVKGCFFKELTLWGDEHSQTIGFFDALLEKLYAEMGRAHDSLAHSRTKEWPTIHAQMLTFDWHRQKEKKKDGRGAALPLPSPARKPSLKRKSKRVSSKARSSQSPTRFFVEAVDSKGLVYFVDCDTDETVWELPSGGMVIESDQGKANTAAAKK